MPAYHDASRQGRLKTKHVTAAEAPARDHDIPCISRDIDANRQIGFKKTCDPLEARSHRAQALINTGTAVRREAMEARRGMMSGEEIPIIDSDDEPIGSLASQDPYMQAVQDATTCDASQQLFHDASLASTQM